MDSKLEATFGEVDFVEGQNGFELVEVKNSAGSATIALQGAQLLSWTPAGEKPVVWLSKNAKYMQGKSVRGGIPICWPWFGPHPEESSYPAHGFARNLVWEVGGTKSLTDATQVVLRLVPNEASWPYPSELECRIKVGQTLEMELITRNTGLEPFTLGCALHTYFEVGDVRKIEILGLEEATYIDKVNGGKNRQSGPVTVNSEVDRIYLDTASDCLIRDPIYNRVIRVEKEGSRSTVVWNPWVDKADKMGDLGDDGYLNMLCVESCNAADDVAIVPPGKSHRLSVRYSVLA